MNARCLLFLLFSLLTVHVTAAQEPPAAPATRAATPGGELERALARVAANDLEGAIALLEPLAEGGDASPRALATLGALYAEIGLVGDALKVLGPLADSGDANPAVLYNAGRSAIELGEKERGEAYLKRSVEAQPVSPAARLLGLRLGARGELVAAYRLLRPWALANPGDVEARLAAAVSALRLERLPEAEELLAGLPPDNPRTRLLQADLALKNRDPAAALALLEALDGEHPPEMATDVAVLLATAYLELGRSAEAVALLADRAGEGPRLAVVLARARHQGGDVDAALETLRPYAAPLLSGPIAQLPPAFKPLAGSIVVEQGRLLLAADRLAEAVPALERATELEPWSREAWQELARAYALAGESEKARQASTRLQEIADARSRATVPGLSGRTKLADPTAKGLAEALEWLERGDGEKALTTVRQEISLAPQDLRPRLLEVRLLLQLERRQEALDSIGATLERFPDHPDALHFRAVVQLSRGDAAAAEADLRKALEQVPGHVPAMNDLALVLAGRGERDEARRLLEKVLELRPGDPLAKQRLAALADGES